MTRFQMSNGLLVPYEPPAQRTQEQLYAEYHAQHEVCHVCGGDNYCTTCTCTFMVPGQEHRDNNHIICACGWKGIRHDMVPKSMERKIRDAYLEKWTGDMDKDFSEVTDAKGIKHKLYDPEDK